MFRDELLRAYLACEALKGTLDDEVPGLYFPLPDSEAHLQAHVERFRAEAQALQGGAPCR